MKADESFPIIDNEGQVLEYENKVTNIISRRVEMSNLSELASTKILEDLKGKLNDCKDRLFENHMIWQYKVCASHQLKIAQNQISILGASSSSCLKSFYYLIAFVLIIVLII